MLPIFIFLHSSSIRSTFLYLLLLEYLLVVLMASARYRASSGVSSRNSNTALPYSKSTHYCMSHAAPYDMAQMGYY
jgi:hypothetical protein